MKIKIDQTLHGYQNGHQLLMSSSPLSSEAKKTLLVQSDLSGSNIDDGFKVYISGYPLATHYAFSKTWYADEMKRPGCVWTHTLLIQFSDLGKIPDLDQLLGYFVRPLKDYYEEYSQPILFEKDEFKNSITFFDDYLAVKSLLAAIYNHPEKTIICPAYNSTDFEKDIVQIWSNQWPRLRRNFSFCTGSLNLKIINGAEFDFQVVPARNIVSIEKQSFDCYVIGNKTEFIEDNWSNLLSNGHKNRLRKFLWLYGSDVKGLRRNYKPLLELYNFSITDEPPFFLINELVSEIFEDNEGILIKKEVYNDGQLFNFNEKDLLNYYASHVNTENRNINERLLNAVKSGKITTEEFINFYFSMGPDSISHDIWNSVSIEPSEIINLLMRDSRLISVFSKKIPEIATDVKTWKLPTSIQLQLIEVLENSNNINWERIIDVILESKSQILFHLLRNNDPRLYYLIKICNKNQFTNCSSDVLSLIFNNKTVLKEYIRKNVETLCAEFCCKIFLNLNYHHLHSIDLDSRQWIIIYKKINDERARIFASCALLSFAFYRKISNPAPLITECFNDVYNFAKNSKINYNEWRMIPIDALEEDDEDTLSSFFSYLFGPKKSDVPSWDYCELLIRTLVNKFIKFRWPLQGFIGSLGTFETTKSAFSYALGFKKGRKFLKDILANVDKGKITVRQDQIQLINHLRREL
ncbi:hypothetical protein [Flavobacterium sp.]|uniref:GAP1-N1 domain-containing protein n=1 Tax=Flavobacterium sp. TaxID=239 RepID=UPI003D133A49